MTRRLRVQKLEIYDLVDKDICQVIVHFDKTPLVLLIDIPKKDVSVEAVAGEICHQVEKKVCRVSATRIEKMVKKAL